ncbi:hypothetical protein IE53DRAFT_384226 [Violaceomyces palustris]|uniref:Uncharacterized protein n=1 Tax=Violaceomyces palustris TaxID=1673888 RepID=A0ACD0P5G5_9BASI|nr:hypothetical protein IE53DRAFT_384226 [Violaceomyces palustris]
MISFPPCFLPPVLLFSLLPFIYIRDRDGDRFLWVFIPPNPSPRFEAFLFEFFSLSCGSVSLTLSLFRFPSPLWRDPRLRPSHLDDHRALRSHAFHPTFISLV